MQRIVVLNIEHRHRATPNASVDVPANATLFVG
jgi:hypothetical protein